MGAASEGALVTREHVRTGMVTEVALEVLRELEQAALMAVGTGRAVMTSGRRALVETVQAVARTMAGTDVVAALAAMLFA